VRALCVLCVPRRRKRNAAVLAEQALKTEQLEAVIVSTKAAQEHAEQLQQQTQTELDSVRAELSALREEIDAVRAENAHPPPTFCTFCFPRCSVHEVCPEPVLANHSFFFFIGNLRKRRCFLAGESE
jgi:hypothetical protein